MPRAGLAALEAGGEAVDCHDHPIRAQGGKAGIGGVIGAIEAVKPVLDPSRRDVAIRGDDGAIVKLHHQGRVILAPVRVDHQAREVGQDHRAVQMFAKPGGKPCGTHVPGDVAGHVFGRDAKIATVHPFGHAIRGVIAGDKPAAGAVFS